jgi:hypothetical protein
MRKLLMFILALLCTCNIFAVSHAIAGTGTIIGKVLLKDGKPATAGIVLFYQKKELVPFDLQKYRFEPEEIAFIGSDGSFRAYLPAGTYYLEAVKRASNDIVGPPQAGEHQGIGINEKGRPNEYIMKSGERKDVGDIIGLVPYKSMNVKNVRTGVTGRILDRNGKPLSDAVVFAYPDIEMTGNALFVSDKTGKDGRYVLGLYTGGTYYLAVESFKKDSPDRTSVYGGLQPAPVILETGEVISGIDIDY